jgi:hypothetical protein
VEVALQPDEVGVRLGLVHGLDEPVQLVRGRPSLRRRPGHHGVELPPHLEEVVGGEAAGGDVQREEGGQPVPLGLDDRSRHRALAAPGPEDADRLQRPERLPQRGAADLEGMGQLPFGGKAVTRAEGAFPDGLLELGYDLLEGSERPRAPTSRRVHQVLLL